MTVSNDYFEIQDHLVRFWRAMDRADYEEVLASLTEDARWRRDRWREGKADIVESLRQRPPLLVSRHCLTNLVVEPDHDGYRCEYGLVIFGYGRKNSEEQPPYSTSGPRMGDWRSKLIYHEGRWLTREVTASLLFERV